MKTGPVLQDERTDAITGMSARLAYLVLYFGVLIIALVRTLAFHQVCLDLLGVVFASSVVALVYVRLKRGWVPWRWALLFAMLGMVVGLALSLLKQYF